jgi:hypothetical protein
VEGVEVDAVSRPHFVSGAVDEHAPHDNPHCVGLLTGCNVMAYGGYVTSAFI